MCPPVVRGCVGRPADSHSADGAVSSTEGFAWAEAGGKFLVMPLYDFRCGKCGHRFEELVRLNDTVDCPKCKARNAERLFSTSAAVSTDKTRGRTAKIARRAATSVHKEKKAADDAYTRNYIKEHSNTD